MIEFNDYINLFKNIPENWDGFGAKSPNQIVIDNTINFIKLIPSEYQEMLNIDNVIISPYGTIIIDLLNNDYFISIEIGMSKIGFFSETPDGENPYEQNIELKTNEIPHQIISTLYKIFK